jgi:hypothetical protein
MTATHDSARDRCLTTGQRAQDPTASKAGPMPSMPYRPPYMRQHHQTRLRKELILPPAAELAEIWQEVKAVWAKTDDLAERQDALDAGVIEADLNGSRANARADAIFDEMRKLTDEIRSERYGDAPEPACDPRHVIEAEMPAEHPDSMTRQLPDADEETFIALCCTDSWAENGGAS